MLVHEVPDAVRVVVVRCKDCMDWGDAPEEHYGNKRFCHSGSWTEFVPSRAEITSGYDGGLLYTAPDFFCPFAVPKRARIRGLSCRLTRASLDDGMTHDKSLWIRARLREAGLVGGLPKIKRGTS